MYRQPLLYKVYIYTGSYPCYMKWIYRQLPLLYKVYIHAATPVFMKLVVKKHKGTPPFVEKRWARGRRYGHAWYICMLLPLWLEATELTLNVMIEEIK